MFVPLMNDGILAVAAPSAAHIGIGWVTPFVMLLGAIAVMPFVNRHWWERWYPAVAIGLGAVAVWPYLFGGQPVGRFVHTMEEYVSFVVLLGALFVISGGIVIKIRRLATPAMNCVLLLMGAVLANLLGTTGASMLLIRPYLRMNRNHLRPYHVVFFIFVVSNVGGSLTPVGDPPLFLGYLMGVPFWWVLEHMRGPSSIAVGALLAIFFVIDTLDHKKQKRVHEHDGGPTVQVVGIHNVLLVLAVVAAVFLDGVFEHLPGAFGGNLRDVFGVLKSREVVMVAAAVLSRYVTRRPVYEANEFTFAPIREVAFLFAGIFAAMVPASQYLQENASQLPLKSAGQYYFTSGVLSSVLDNAPTYKTLLETRLATIDPAGDMSALQTLLAHPDLSQFLLAISAGSVFWGACTYIGNGPNFMVKSIADSAGLRTPSFGQYVWKYTIPVLIPVYILIWAVYFR